MVRVDGKLRLRMENGFLVGYVARISPLLPYDEPDPGYSRYSTVGGRLAHALDKSRGWMLPAPTRPRRSGPAQRF